MKFLGPFDHFNRHIDVIRPSSDFYSTMVVCGIPPNSDFYSTMVVCGIPPSSDFYSTMMVCDIPNDDPHMMTHKDRAWKFKRNSIEFHMLDARSLNDNHAFQGVPKDWAWKFKEKVICSSSVF